MRGAAVVRGAPGKEEKVSRLPRGQEYLKTGFTAEAAAAARFRAYARRAESDGRANLAKAWLELAAEKDALAIAQLEATGQVRGEGHDLATALAEERYENESLYPRMQREVDAATGEVFASVMAAQERHAARLRELSVELRRSLGDLPVA